MIARVGPAEYEEALSEYHAREFDITGRPMKGWVMIEPAGIESADELRYWVSLAVKFTRSLPAK